MRLVDLTGKSFGALTVLGRDCKHHGTQVKWICVCECGNQKSVQGGHLKQGRSQTCGCRIRGLKGNYRHGHSGSATYRSWQAAKGRVFIPKNGAYENYGGRGITMCERWASDFCLFLEDMGEKPDGFSLERKDVNGNYEPGNCKWIPRRDQCLNRRSTVFATYKGETKTLTEWARSLKVVPRSLRVTLRRLSENNSIPGWLGTSVLEPKQNFVWM